MWGLEKNVQICIAMETPVKESCIIISGERRKALKLTHTLLVKLKIYFLEKKNIEAIVFSEERENNMKVIYFK